MPVRIPGQRPVNDSAHYRAATAVAPVRAKGSDQQKNGEQGVARRVTSPFLKVNLPANSRAAPTTR